MITLKKESVLLRKYFFNYLDRDFKNKPIAITIHSSSHFYTSPKDCVGWVMSLQQFSPWLVDQTRSKQPDRTLERHMYKQVLRNISLNNNQRKHRNQNEVPEGNNNHKLLSEKIN